jgi:hypothetical protein
MGQVGDAELAVALEDPAGPVGENVAEAVLRLWSLEGWIRDEVVSSADGRGQNQQGGESVGKAGVRAYHGG